MKYTTFLFDFDGTVINSIEAIVLSVKETFAHFDFPEPDEAEIKKYIGIPLHNYFPYLGKEHYMRHDPKEVIGKYREIYEKSYGRTHINVYDGMEQLLRTLKQKGARLGIVSSKVTQPIEMNLEDTGLTGLFDVIIGSDQVSHYKPLPQTVFLCAHKIGLEDATTALVIGDSPHDIEMGQRANMDTCAVPWGAGSEQELADKNPTYFAKDMQALSQILMQDG